MFSNKSLYRARSGIVFLALAAVMAVGSCSEEQNDAVAPDDRSGPAEAPRRLTAGPYLDIMPDTCPNPVNPKARGGMLVAVLGGRDTIVVDMSTPPASMDTCACTAEGPDGFKDLVLLFSIQEVIEAISPVAVGSQRLLTLTGQTNIETPFEARDCLLISGEYVSQPDTPTGDGLTNMGRFINVSTGGAATSLGHPVEYRFDLDADGAHRYTDWSQNWSAQVNWDSAGTYTVTGEARCALHRRFVSLPSQGRLNVKVNEGPDTQIFNMINTYYINFQRFDEFIDINDAIPDTVPYGSWINIFYRGIRPPADSTNCFDFDNECLRYQNNYTSRSTFVPFMSTIPWLPFTPKDSNPFGTSDSTSMNVGSLEYTVRARTTDEFGFVDITPPEVEIIGNFDPTLDAFGLENFDGFFAGDGDSIDWDWLAPANLDPLMPSISDTVDFSVSPPQTVKRWYFLVAATGHDHPKEPTGSGVKAWLYRFTRADDPNFEQPFARSGSWADGMTVNVLRDSVVLEVRYEWSFVDSTSSKEAWRNLPDWLNRGYDYSMQGRDTKSTDVFRQYMWVDGVRTLLNEFPTGVLGRRTVQRQLPFYIGIHP
jgi:hypothetical protein